MMHVNALDLLCPTTVAMRQRMPQCTVTAQRPHYTPGQPTTGIGRGRQICDTARWGQKVKQRVPEGGRQTDEGSGHLEERHLSPLAGVNSAE
jgi:hypothetical protein